MPDLWPLRRPAGNRRLRFPLSAPRIAVDLLGGDTGLDAVVDGAVLAAERWPDLGLLLVGPPGETRAALAARGVDPGDRIRIVAASQCIAMDEDPVRAVRSRRDATVRVASRLLRDAEADATVTVGSTGAAVAAALFTLGRLPGVTRPPLAVTVPAPRRPVVLLDAGATTTAGADLLVQFALAGAAYAQVRLGVAEPTVGLLSIGSEPGKGDPVRREAEQRLAELLPQLGVRFAGNVESQAVALGGVVDVVVTDGFTGNVLLKGMEGAIGAVLAAAAGDLDRAGTAALAGVVSRLGPESQGGAVLLGVNGVVVVGHGSSSPAAVASCIGAAASAAREGLVPRLTDALAALIAHRRAEPPHSRLMPA
ncbi:MAG TPA: phosphate starvation-inducible protein PhoH [Frankiaceae bacterium]|nr:phosphate starvation-inducible protein PhoH [Frankiaceae bacterium]